MKLSKDQARLLRALISGASLKSHRYLDGTKVYQLHPLAGSPEPVQKSIIEALTKASLIYSNQKFPAATYLLTEKGREVATRLAEDFPSLDPESLT